MTDLQGVVRYRISGRIGEGGMGEIFVGTMSSAAGERQVALKRLLPRDESTAEAKARLIEEARLVFQLSHANICQMYDVAENESGTFLVMEHVRGLDAGALLEKSGGPLDVASALYIAREAAQALDYAHRRTNDAGSSFLLVHGDVTPRNILLSVDGEVKLSDFGVARALGATAPGNRLRAGTAGYAAPEWGSAIADFRADIYSLGMVLFVLLTGRNPDAREVAEIERHRPEVNRESAALLARATAATPDDRFLTSGDFARQLTLELARHYPDFSPTLLGQKVRSQTVPTVVSEPIFDTIQSITHGGAPRAAVVVDGPASRPPTFTLARTPRARSARRLWTIGALVIGCAASFLLWSRRAAHHPQPAAKPTLAAAQSPLDASLAPVKLDESEKPEVASQDSQQTEPVAPKARKSSAPGFVSVTSDPWGALYVDGRRVADETPVYRLRLAPGPHRIAIYYPARQRYSATKLVTVHPGSVQVLGFRE